MFVIERERMYTSNPCNPIRDGRITPENVHPIARNPIIAGFFREIGCADRLGSGIRNLYKYSKDYGGADPVFTEGSEFVISVSLKKLDPIRFPFGKPSIGGGKPSVGNEEPSIGDEKPSIRSMLAGLRLTRPTCENIMRLYEAFGTTEVFGRSRVMSVAELSNGPAGELIKTLLAHRLVDTVVGQGKGKYRFHDFQ